jgi:hypothetical protein
LGVLIGGIIFNIQMTFTSILQKICPNAYAMDCETDLIDICDIGRVTYQGTGPSHYVSSKWEIEYEMAPTNN